MKHKLYVSVILFLFGHLLNAQIVSDTDLADMYNQALTKKFKNGTHPDQNKFGGVAITTDFSVSSLISSVGSNNFIYSDTLNLVELLPPPCNKNKSRIIYGIGHKVVDETHVEIYLSFGIARKGMCIAGQSDVIWRGYSSNYNSGKIYHFSHTGTSGSWKLN